MDFTQEITELKTMLNAAIASKASAETVNQIQRQLDALDSKMAERVGGGGYVVNGLKKTLQEDTRLNDWLQLKSGSFHFNLDQRMVPSLGIKGTDSVDTSYANVITSADVTAQTTGVLTINRIPGITAEARQRLQLRDLLYSRPTTQQVIDFVKVNAAMTIGSPQTEASDKAQNSVTFTSQSEKIRTLATWIPASRQVLDDMDELFAFLTTSLPYFVNLDEEIEMLTGDGTGQHLHGLIPQATAFGSVGLSASAGWNRIDVVGRVVEQIMNAKEIAPTFIVLNPTDFWNIRLTKDSYGRYVMGDPQMPVNVQVGAAVKNAGNLFGLIPVPTTSIAAGSFLVGNGDPTAVEIRDRMEMQVEIATQHADFFAKNLVAIRAEKRVALVVKRPGSFITGSWTTSPVGQ
jgi:HK97 family phage major capsid protein